MKLEIWQQLKNLFNEALELMPEKRAAFLATACAGNEELRGQVEKLLAAHDDAGAFLNSPVLLDAGIVSDGEDSQASQPSAIGRMVGPYEILREIGHGGMGTVFLAVRADDQYRKLVAIKLVNRGMLIRT